MFESAIGNSTQKLGLEQEIAESGRVDADIAALLVGTSAAHSQVALLGRRGGTAISSGVAGSRGGGIGGFGGLELLVGVVDEILFGGHVER